MKILAQNFPLYEVEWASNLTFSPSTLRRFTHHGFVSFVVKQEMNWQYSAFLIARTVSYELLVLLINICKKRRTKQKRRWVIDTFNSTSNVLMLKRVFECRTRCWFFRVEKDKVDISLPKNLVTLKLTFFSLPSSPPKCLIKSKTRVINQAATIASSNSFVSRQPQTTKGRRQYSLFVISFFSFLNEFFSPQITSLCVSPLAQSTMSLWGLKASRRSSNNVAS